VQKREFEDVMQNSSNATLKAQVGILEDFSGTVWLTEDKGSIDNLIHYEITGAHCQYHQAVWVKENDEIIFFGADVAPQLQQMKSRFVAKYDLDGKKALAYRQHWWEEGNKEGWTFAFYHDINQPTHISASSI
jgi:hypothetical protein